MDGEVSPEDVAALLDADADVRVVDIRSPEAFARGHVPGSECIPFPHLPSQVDRLDGADRIVTVCPHGESSVRAARLIASYEGIPESATVESMAGGLTAWDGELATGHPETVDDGPSTQSSDAPF